VALSGVAAETDKCISVLTGAIVTVRVALDAYITSVMETN